VHEKHPQGDTERGRGGGKGGDTYVVELWHVVGAAVIFVRSRGNLTIGLKIEGR